MTSTPNIYHTLGKIEAQVATICQKLDKNTRDIEQIKRNQDQVLGGSRVLFWLIAGSGSIGAAITWVIHHFNGK